MNNIESRLPDPQPRIGALQLLIICTTLTVLVCVVTAALMWKNTLSAVQPRISVTTAVAATVGDLKRESKLVVLSLPISITIHKISTKDPLWGILPQGTSEVLMMVPDNRVQYVLHLEPVTASNFEFDAANHKLRFQAPAPVLDEEMVSMQADPDKIKIMSSTGWLRMDRFTGEKLKAAARQDVRNQVLAEARRPHYQDVAREIAELHLRKLLEPMMRTMDSNVALVIEFPDDAMRSDAKVESSEPEVAK